MEGALPAGGDVPAQVGGQRGIGEHDRHPTQLVAIVIDPGGMGRQDLADHRRRVRRDAAAVDRIEVRPPVIVDDRHDEVGFGRGRAQAGQRRKAHHLLVRRHQGPVREPRPALHSALRQTQ